MLGLLTLAQSQTPALGEQRQVGYLLMLSLALLVLLVAFVLGVYVLVRMGRALRQRSLGGEPTDHSDAWSRYRLSEEDIERATSEPFDPRRSSAADAPPPEDWRPPDEDWRPPDEDWQPPDDDDERR